ncbi:1-deoxy-D-xylulose-5-phosphate synthase [Alkanindiges illinoisensis]|uniref:1-deoxy-D-xylulose-5-phosphate synthase n=1 Tax=Alkanindiges illinoisensis TaxID=197183 RepID=A0A4Y7XDU3_9GAMM|nr:1-deoxy-D-xylulose-5-phosphate synthase [Alkanindiges illinoisensis]TEU29332.1 1-deoxy-D-xylulose-5-phosphate synthase [Alkanindiges illinoisensis]
MMYDTIPTARPATPLLDRIDQPSQLKTLDTAQLLQLADELRLYLLYAAGQSGGHFGANLGVVELTIALHHALDTPKDRLVWDVGHQAYAHKVLTGRREALPTIRSKDGLAAFPTREESAFDTFGVGHSSTSISAALGMALALRYQNDERRVACVVGDGAMTAGMAFEAMNDAVQHNADVLVVLNDNDMSISGSVGGFAKHLGALWKQGQSVYLADNGEVSIQPHPNWTFNPRVNSNNSAENLFRAIGFEYFGPVDGHNLKELVRILALLKDRKGPRLLHVYTTKGKGFLPAEADPIGYHAITKITSQATSPVKAPQQLPKPQKYADVFGQFLCDQAALDDRLLAITPAMCEGSGMVQFASQYPERFFDVAIAEQHAVTLAAGMACEGLKPVVAIYSTFLQRGYDQLIHDVALQNLDVTFGIDRAGLVGEDGPTHAGAYDYAYMRTIPHLILMAPKDENECRQMLHTAYQYPGPAAVRYPRGTGPGSQIASEFTTLEIGKAEIVAQHYLDASQQIALLAFGSMVTPALQAAEQLASPQLGVTVVNMRFIKPLDQQLLARLSAQVNAFITIEEHAIMGGAGSAVNESLQAQHLLKPVLNLGLPDAFLHQATHPQMLAECGLNGDGITRDVQRFMQTLAGTI